MDNTLSTFAAPATPAPTISPAAQAAAALRAFVPQQLKQLIDARNAQHRRFWADPVNIAKELGTGAVPLFTQDATTVGYITKLLMDAGVAGDQLLNLLPGIPDTYTVDYSKGDGSVTIAPTAAYWLPLWIAAIKRNQQATKNLAMANAAKGNPTQQQAIDMATKAIAASKADIDAAQAGWQAASGSQTTPPEVTAALAE